MSDVLMTRRQLRRANRDLLNENGSLKQREAHYAKTDRDMSRLQTLYDEMVRTTGTMDSTEVTALKRIITGLEGEKRVLERKLADVPTVAVMARDLAARDETIREMSKQLTVTHEAMRLAAEAPAWNPAGVDDPAKALRQARRQIIALEQRVADLTAASVAKDTNHSEQPWIGEQQRAVTQ